MAATGGGMYSMAGRQLPAFSQFCFFQEAAIADHHGHYSSCLPLSDEVFMGRNMVQTPAISEYDMGEGDLFTAPERILEEPALELDPMTAAFSIISGGDDAITETTEVADIESIQNDHLTDVFYECNKDLLEKSEIEDSISELLNVNIPALQMDEVAPMENLSYAEGPMQRSVSSGCLNLVEQFPGGTTAPDFLDFQEIDFEAAFGLRRAFSEGDIQNLGNKKTSNGNATAVCSSFEQLLAISDVKSERQQKLSRYREKKSKRNFHKKIKYACRKVLADSQPRVRGRFAKTETEHAARCELELGLAFTQKKRDVEPGKALKSAAAIPQLPFLLQGCSWIN